MQENGWPTAENGKINIENLKKKLLKKYLKLLKFIRKLFKNGFKMSEIVKNSWNQLKTVQNGQFFWLSKFLSFLV